MRASDFEIQNHDKLDNILAELCSLVIQGQQKGQDLGMVAAAVLDPDNNCVVGINYPTKDGSCIRDYIDVNDLSELHILCLNKLNKSKSFLLNCGYGKGYSVKEIVYAFSSYIKKKIKINIKNRREGDAEAIYCDTRKLKKIFPKWKGSSNIQDSIKTAMNWEKNL